MFRIVYKWENDRQHGQTELKEVFETLSGAFKQRAIEQEIVGSGTSEHGQADIDVMVVDMPGYRVGLVQLTEIVLDDDVYTIVNENHIDIYKCKTQLNNDYLYEFEGNVYRCPDYKLNDTLKEQFKEGEAQLQKFEGYVFETLERVVDIYATSEHEAIQKLRKMYKNGEIVLDSGDFVDVDFDISNSQGMAIQTLNAQEDESDD